VRQSDRLVGPLELQSVTTQDEDTASPITTIHTESEGTSTSGNIVCIDEAPPKHVPVQSRYGRIIKTTSKMYESCEHTKAQGN